MRISKKMALLMVLMLAIMTALFVFIKEWNPFHRAGQNSFIETADGKIVDASGVEYSFLAHDGELLFLKKNPHLFYWMVFEGSIAGEPDTLRHLGGSWQTGMYSLRGDRSFDILVRIHPDSEWYTVYRKTDLPPFDFSTEKYP